MLNVFLSNIAASMINDYRDCKKIIKKTWRKTDPRPEYTDDTPYVLQGLLQYVVATTVGYKATHVQN